ncbi:MAG: family 78 glycoside hydrolase catalytic domain, partial [Nitrososphaeria archaeon]
SINGQRVGDKVLDPAQTDYSKVALYSTYDVTELLKGKNAIGVILGNGRHIKAYGYDFPKLIFQLEIEFKGGKKAYILSDKSWKVSHGPLMENGIYFGERYDANLEMENWNKFDFDDSNWEECIETTGPSLSPQTMPPIRVVDTLKPVKMHSPKEGIYVYDFGQNFTGWVRLHVKGPKGTEVKIKHAEVLNPDGTLNFSTIRNAEATDTYILKGEGEETYEPRFTYHGFRYAQVEGFPGVPTLESLEGRVVHTDVEKIGDFYCSNETINTIHRNTLRSQLSNLMSIPTDCPQRDERLGWTGDAQLSAEEAIYNFDMLEFYKKWLKDLQLSQREDGSLPDVAPTYNAQFYPADPAWATAYITIAWYLYWYYNDKNVLNEHYESMKKYVEFLKNNSENNISKLGKYGDWCPPGSVFPKRTPVELTSTFYYYNDVLLLSKIADVLKKDDDAKNYSRLSEEIKAAFNQKFLTSNGYDVIKMSPIDQGTGQTSNVLPLFYDMVPQDRKQEIIQKLLNLITNDQDFHLDTGIIGTKYIFDVLAENGYAEIAYKIVTQESYPSFGYMIKEGATTLWERWEKLMGGGMNSHNHVMFGSVDAWFYKYLAGLSPIVAGWKKFKVKPYIVGDLKYVSSSIATVRGKIKVSWERSDNAFKLNLSVPNECQAELHLPVLWEKYSISENGKEMKFAEQRKARVVFDVNSGNYEFTIKKMN